jgi:DNA-binding NarL/FixJ family response regulator
MADSALVPDMGDAPLRVLVCANQPIVREGVAQILRDAGFDVVATAQDAFELLRKARAHRPDVVVTDVRLSPNDLDDGLRAAKTIRRELYGTGVLVLARAIQTQGALDLVGDRPHGVGLLLKQHIDDLTTLTDAVRQVACGRSALDPDVIHQLTSRRPENDDTLSRLTAKEHQVLALIADGLSNQGVADELVVTVPAVERHITSIFGKLELEQTPHRHRRVLAVLRYLGTEVGRARR